jgi:hypothetical protein
VTASERRLVAALRQLLRAYEMVMPGIGYISVPDYKLINEAPIEAERAIKAAENPQVQAS